jgi:hypothetical protein
LNCEAGLRVTLEILGVTAAGAPSSTVLSTTLLSPGLDEEEPLREFVLATPVSITRGDRFAIAVAGPASEGCAMGGGGLNAYAGGKGFYDARPDPPAWYEMAYDLPFQTLMFP